VNQDNKEQVERAAEELLNRRLGQGAVQMVEVLQHGDEPVIEPGQAMVRVTLNATDGDPHKTLDAFEKAHAAAIRDLRKGLSQEMPFIEGVQFTVAAESEEGGRPVLTIPIGPPDRMAVGRNSTPVMARLDPKDIETLDALITAGIVSNRAEGIRWALARIRERPAYGQLREHIGKLDEIKAQF
jgi:hypothetical protein